MQQSVFTEAETKLTSAAKALEDLRIEYYGKRLTAEQRARIKSSMGTLARELTATAEVLDGK